MQQGLVEQLKIFLIELGRDFCYVGSQYPLQVGGRDFAFLCERKDGTTAKVPANNNAVSEVASPEFLKKVKEFGIPIMDET